MISVYQLVLLALFLSLVTSAVICQVPEDVFIADLYEILVGTLSPIQDPFGIALVHLGNRMELNLALMVYLMKKHFKTMVEWARHNPIYAMLMAAGLVRIYVEYMAQIKKDEVK